MSPDLRHALVFATVLGHKDITPLLPALQRVAPFLRAQLAPKLGLRVTPELKFVKDEALEQATKINKLLHKPEVARDLTAEAKAAAAKAEQDALEEKAQGAALHPLAPEAPDPH
jgi:ribosome-binding factor A